jgi:hypothetical protein
MAQKSNTGKGPVSYVSYGTRPIWAKVGHASIADHRNHGTKSNTGKGPVSYVSYGTRPIWAKVGHARDRRPPAMARRPFWA